MYSCTGEDIHQYEIVENLLREPTGTLGGGATQMNLLQENQYGKTESN
jgi:hypothetical protein